MYAVIESGGKQFRVELGSEIEVETMEGEPGSTVELGRVLLVADGDDAQIGRPVVEGARVSASVVRQDRGPKLVVFKYRPKARHRARQGHRQGLTRLRVSDIVLGERSAAKQEEAARGERDRSRAAAEAEAARKASADEALARKLARQAAADKAAEEPAPARGRARAASTTTTAKTSGRGTKPAAAPKKKTPTRTTTARTATREPARRTQAGGRESAKTSSSRPAKSAARKTSAGTSTRRTTSTSKTQSSRTQPKRRSTGK